VCAAYPLDFRNKLIMKQSKKPEWTLRTKSGLKNRDSKSSHNFKYIQFNKRFYKRVCCLSQLFKDNLQISNNNHVNGRGGYKIILKCFFMHKFEQRISLTCVLYGFVIRFCLFFVSLNFDDISLGAIQDKTWIVLATAAILAHWQSIATVVAI